tara:strand:+ start:1626 stop:2237 length:612 start_codon:yes stop_codon:yes gene_type:complete
MKPNYKSSHLNKPIKTPQETYIFHDGWECPTPRKSPKCKHIRKPDRINKLPSRTTGRGSHGISKRKSCFCETHGGCQAFCAGSELCSPNMCTNVLSDMGEPLVWCDELGGNPPPPPPPGGGPNPETDECTARCADRLNYLCNQLYNYAVMYHEDAGGYSWTEYIANNVCLPTNHPHWEHGSFYSWDAYCDIAPRSKSMHDTPI